VSLAVVSTVGAAVVSVAGAAASVAGAVLSVDSDSPPPQAVKANPAISILMATRIVLVDLNIGNFFVCKPR
jgi:long-subunit fatty acid transport protein